MQTVEKVVEVPQVGQTMQGTTREVDIPLAPRREDGGKTWLHGFEPHDLETKYTSVSDHFSSMSSALKASRTICARSTLRKSSSR